ncbi:tetratricopeptide repeat protein [Streptomyces bluensis]|uniref:tetratricopeptide repeat protein n=1 Tax=Streptomyces bluensis TaxID=33897 RepID=UPI00167357F2|nr:tetratricopeptide repeat protein [Streptomyces bluensis]GGZ80074.1 hypothetical protein GCM10010344_54000 [Streptomyces bluensis]
MTAGGANASPAFRQEVRAEGGFAYGVIGADIHVFGDGTPLYLLENWRPAPQTDPQWLRELPSRMLNARHEVVAFTGREAELAALHRWRDEGPRLAVRWLSGPGGQGKTRLVAQLAARSVAAGWKVVNATHGPGTVLPPPGSQDLRLNDACGLLLVVDYADRWPLTHLTWLLSNALLHQTTVRTRILLLGRTDDSWPAVRAALANHQAGTSAQLLSPLPSQEAGPRAQMFRAARDSFAVRYGLTSPAGITPPGSLERPDFGLTLAVHIAALVAVDAHATGRRPPDDMAGLTIYLLDREHLHWVHLYGDETHEIRPGERTYRTPPQVMNQTVFTAALTGSLESSTGTAVLKTLRLGPAPERILADHAVCYPPADPTRTTVLEPLYPDRLAEDFLALTLPGHQADYPAQTWAAPTTTALLTDPRLQEARQGFGWLQRRRNTRIPPSWTPRAVTLLATAIERWPHLGPQHLYPLLRANPRLAVAAGSAALTALAALDDIDPSLLEAIESHFPDGLHTDLDVGIAAVASRLAKHRLAHTDDPAERVNIHYHLSFSLTHAGRYVEALTASQQAVALCRPLARSDPAAYEGYLAQCLIALGASLSQVGRRQEALAASEEVVALLLRMQRDRRHWRIATRDLPVLTIGFAHALNNLGAELSAAGRSREALAACEEAVSILRPLAKASPADNEPALATSLISLGASLSANSRRGEALAVVQEAVTLLRRLAHDHPAVHSPALASSLANLSVELESVGRHSEALAASEEAVTVLRRLASQIPAAYELDLGISLMDLGNHLAHFRRLDEALAVFEEAVTVLRRLASQIPEAHEPDLARALTELGSALAVTGRLEEALNTAKEAASIRRRGHDIADSDFQLANLLRNLGYSLPEMGFLEEAVDAAEEAVAMHRWLGADPDTSERYLAEALTDLSDSLAETGREREALAAAEEASAIRRRLGEDQSGTLELSPADMARDISNAWAEMALLEEERQAAAGETRPLGDITGRRGLGIELDVVRFMTGQCAALEREGRTQEAAAMAEEVVVMWRSLARVNPTYHEPGLASMLTDLGALLWDVGRLDKALTTTEEAVTIRRRLARANPADNEPDFAVALHNLSIYLVEMGRRDEALTAAEEAIAVWRRLAKAQPSVYEPELADTLHNLSVCLSKVGRRDEALTAAEEATAIRQKWDGRM